MDEPDWPAEIPESDKATQAATQAARRSHPRGYGACRAAARLLVAGWGGSVDDVEHVTYILFRWCLASLTAPEEHAGGVVPFGTVEGSRRIEEINRERARQEAARQAAVLETYIDLILENGVPPTVRAVCDRLGYIHPASVHVPL
ncbi:MAG: hypothetical protein EON58_10140, partial [Alphaproteobacteria bacterium]